jgi:nitrile hydratase
MAGLETNGVHDLGGSLSELHAPIDRAEKPYQQWEIAVHALVGLLSKKGLMTVDELRRGIEDLPEEAYKNLSYYEKWAASTAAIQMERGTIQQADLDRVLGKPLKEEPARFKEGDIVRVKRENAAVRIRKPHLRTPGYIFGVVGVVERECVGMAPNPEAEAFRQELPRQPLYRVRFRQADVWDLYSGSPEDTLDIEIYQAWLEAASEQDLQQQQQQSQQRREQEHDHHHSHAHSHDHAHDHDGQHGVIDHGDHVHEARTTVEQNAVDKEGADDAERRRFPEALVEVFKQKGIVTAEEVRSSVEEMDNKGKKGLGAVLVAKAWTDPDFKDKLLKNAGAAAAELGISSSNFTPKTTPASPEQNAGAGPPGISGTILTAVANTEKVHNLVVCTLCSCYPVAVLGMSPAWYKSRAYRARAVREPRKVLEDFGTHVRDDVAIRVHDSTADMRYIVVPQRPEGTEGWSEEQLRSLVTRDSMVGVTNALSPDQLSS